MTRSARLASYGIPPALWAQVQGRLRLAKKLPPAKRVKAVLRVVDWLWARRDLAAGLKLSRMA
jgi:hypothetical protein